MLLILLLMFLTLNLRVEIVGDDLELSEAHFPHVPSLQIPLHQALTDVGQVGKLKVDVYKK